MNEEQLIQALRERAANPTKRTDYAYRVPRELGALATTNVIESAQRAMKCVLYPLHQRVLMEVGNGGFGPGDGLIGLPGGSLDVHELSIVELHEILFHTNASANADAPAHLPIVPLCDWGDGIYSCVDCETGAILTMSEFGLKETEDSLFSWLQAWVSGLDLLQRTVELEDRIMKHPMTGRPLTAQIVVGTKGRPRQ